METIGTIDKTLIRINDTKILKIIIEIINLFCLIKTLKQKFKNFSFQIKLYNCDSTYKKNFNIKNE